MTDTIDINELARAREALAQATTLAQPIMSVLTQMGTVFDAIQNATAHRAVLERDVADQSAQLTKITSTRDDLLAQVADANARAIAAENDAKQRMQEAQATADESIADLHVQLAAQVKAAQENTQAELDKLAGELADAQAKHTDELSAMAAEKVDMQEQIDKLEASLNSLKTSAQRFTDALRG